MNLPEDERPVLAYIVPEKAWHTASYDASLGLWFVTLQNGLGFCSYPPEAVTGIIELEELEYRLQS